MATLTISDNNDPLPALSINDITVGEGDGLNNTSASFTVSLSAASGYTVAVFYSTSNGTAQSGDYNGTNSGFVSFAPGQLMRTVSIPIVGDRNIESDETFFVTLSTPTRAVIGRAQGQATIEDDDGDPPGVKFAFPDQGLGEHQGVLSVIVTRTGLISGPASVEYASSDVTASERSDYTTAVGRVLFAPGEHTKTVQVLLGDDRFVEDVETFRLTLSNPSGASVGPNSTTTITIFDNDFVNGPSPVAWGPDLSPSFFVWQHYADFFNRPPDDSGLQFWTNQMTNCGNPNLEVCRINVSAAFFVSIEFQQTGYLAYRARKAAFGNIPNKPVPVTRLELLRDMHVLGSELIVNTPGWEQRLEANKQIYFAELAASQRFTTLYPQTLTPSSSWTRSTQTRAARSRRPSATPWSTICGTMLRRARRC